MNSKSESCASEMSREKAKSIYGSNFRELFTDLIAGTPIKRKPWKGYWRYCYGKIEMHCKDGSIVDFLDTKDIIFTLSGILKNDWVIANPDNCELLKEKEE